LSQYTAGYVPGLHGAARHAARIGVALNVCGLGAAICRAECRLAPARAQLPKNGVPLRATAGATQPRWREPRDVVGVFWSRSTAWRRIHAPRTCSMSRHYLGKGAN